MHAMAAGSAARLAAERASRTELARLRELVARMLAAGDATELHRKEGTTRPGWCRIPRHPLWHPRFW